MRYILTIISKIFHLIINAHYDDCFFIVFRYRINKDHFRKVIYTLVYIKDAVFSCERQHLKLTYFRCFFRILNLLNFFH